MQSLWMVAASLLFACMGVCVKLASQAYPAALLVFARGAVATLLLGGFILLRGHTLATPLWRGHLVRCISGYISLLAYFVSIAMIPLAAAVTLNYTSPLFLALLLAFWTREPVRPALYGALALGFVGVTMLLQPTLTPEQWLGALLGLTSGIVSSVAYLNVRRLGELGEPEWRTVFYFSAFSAVASLPWLLAAGPLPEIDGRGAWLLFGTGAFGAAAQLCMTAAYKRGKTLASASLAYTTVVFASLFGIVLWDEHLAPLAWAGIAVVAAAGIAAMALSQGRPAAPAEQD